MEAAILISDGVLRPKSKGRPARSRHDPVSPGQGAWQDRGQRREAALAPYETPKPGAADDAAAYAALMTRVAQGDRAAFGRLFGVYAPRVKGYLLRLGLEAAQAEEVSQEVMIAVWRKAASYDPRQASVATWIFRIARNRRIDVFRRARKGALDPDDPTFQPQAEARPDQAFETAGREAQVRAAMAQLPDDQRELVRDAFYEDLSHSQIADKTGLPLGTVKSRLRLAFAKLKLRLDGEQSEGERP
jgi:RNA polymerase sigma-70 factor (ECF subfamily)